MVKEVIENVRHSASGRRIFTSEQKVYIVESWESSGLSGPEFCRRNGITTPQLYIWRKNSKRGSFMGIQNDGHIHSKAEFDALKKENEELKLALAEVETFSREFKLSQNKIIAILGIPKSSVFYKKKAYPQKRNSTKKVIAKTVTVAIKEIIKDRSTYGVPRITALLKRDHSLDVTRYMVHRYLKENGLLITVNRTRGTGRDHSGKIAVNEINTRWATDITSIKCWNGEKIRVAIVIDCCDRSVIACKAQKHIQACDIELMVQEAMWKRFGDKLPSKGQLQLLHDNGPEFIEKILNQNLKSWNIESCNTPTYSPQSNGMVEAWNGTFKRDYVYENCLDSPEYVKELIPKWIQDYNDYAPHSALNMQTSTEYFNLNRVA